MIVLGIETTCDETAAAVVERRPDGRGEIMSNIVLSQIADHAAFGGVVPEIAARAHVEILDLLDRPRDARGRLRLQRSRRHRGGGRPRADRRRDRRPDHRQGDRAGAGEAADRRQSSRGACAHAAADRRRAVPLLPVSRLRRPHPDRRGARRRRLCAARHHARRRHRRGLRQDRKAARARLSGRPAGRARSAIRRPRPLRVAAPDGGPPRLRFLALRPEDGAAARGREDRAAHRPGRRRSVRRRSSRRWSTWWLDRLRCGLRMFRDTLRHAVRRWSRPAASPPTRRSARCCTGSPSRPPPCWWCRRPSCAPTTAP